MPEQQEDAGKAARDKAIAEGNALKEKSLAEFAERTKGKPTPTQDENDRAKLGEHIIEHEHDGSDPDPSTVQAEPLKSKQATPSGGAASYQTRQATPVSPRSSGSKSE